MNKITRAIAESRLARVAALPSRFRSVLSHNFRVAFVSTRWLVQSREHTNYTYDLTERNEEHLAWWLANVTGEPVARMREYMRELSTDKNLQRHISESTSLSARRGLADPVGRYARRLAWYALVRSARPRLVVETGTDKGLGSLVLASAILRNGVGALTTIDINPAAGYLISSPYAAVIHRVNGDSAQALADISSEVDFFIHDSLHTYDYERRELDALSARLSRSALVLSDNAHESDALAHWAEETGRTFSYFQEVPTRHWYPGGGIGIAWTPVGRTTVD